MKCIKYYFLVFFISNVFSLSSMELSTQENSENCSIMDSDKLRQNLYEVSDKIETDVLLKTKDNRWGSSVINCLYSWHKWYYLTNEQAIEEMNTIESWIAEDKKLVLEKLEQKHWYVYDLLNLLKEVKLKEINNVKGSTIDILCNLPSEEGYKKIVHMRALHWYAAGVMGLKELYRDVVGLKNRENIHWTLLYGHKEDIASLKISSDDKYLRSKGDCFEKIIWDIEQGTKTNLSGKESQFNYIEWYVSHPFTPLFSSKNYAAIECTSSVSEPTIQLLKRPTRKSFMCQQAFQNSKDVPQELTALRNSETFKLIKGFPKKNLEQYIDKRLEELSSTPHLSEVAVI